MERGNLGALFRRKHMKQGLSLRHTETTGIGSHFIKRLSNVTMEDRHFSKSCKAKDIEILKGV